MIPGLSISIGKMRSELGQLQFKVSAIQRNNLSGNRCGDTLKRRPVNISTLASGRLIANRNIRIRLAWKNFLHLEEKYPTVLLVVLQKIRGQEGTAFAYQPGSLKPVAPPAQR